MTVVELCCVIQATTTSVLVTLNTWFAMMMWLSQNVITLQLRYVKKAIVSYMLFSCFWQLEVILHIARRKTTGHQLYKCNKNCRFVTTCKAHN